MVVLLLLGHNLAIGPHFAKVGAAVTKPVSAMQCQTLVLLFDLVDVFSLNLAEFQNCLGHSIGHHSVVLADLVAILVLSYLGLILGKLAKAEDHDPSDEEESENSYQALDGIDWVVNGF